ncbi:MAG: tRNA-dihydrouridine synthase, partial [Neisseriaceae bacterium]
HRTGIDYEDSYEYMRDFVAGIAKTGCNDFIIHARNAVLQGLSPRENRKIPPLKYNYVYKLKKEMPHLNIMINGGIKTLSSINEHLGHVDGVMLGREAYYNPFLFADFDVLFFDYKANPRSRQQIAESMITYLEQMHSLNIPLHRVTRHMIGLYYGCPNARLWRYTLTQEIIKTNSVATYTDLISNLK